MKVDLQVWHSGEEFSIDVWFLSLSLYIAQMLHSLFLLYGFTTKELFYFKYYHFP